MTNGDQSRLEIVREGITEEIYTWYLLIWFQLSKWWLHMGTWCMTIWHMGTRCTTICTTSTISTMWHHIHPCRTTVQGGIQWLSLPAICGPLTFPTSPQMANIWGLPWSRDSYHQPLLILPPTPTVLMHSLRRTFIVRLLEKKLYICDWSFLS